MSTTTIIWSVFAIFALIVFIVVYYNMVIKPEKIKQQRMKNQSLLSEKQAALATLITIRNNKIKIVDKKIEQWLSSQAVDDSTDPDFSEVIRLYHQLGNCSEFERSDAIQRCFQKQLPAMQSKILGNTSRYQYGIWYPRVYFSVNEQHIGSAGATNRNCQRIYSQLDILS